MCVIAFEETFSAIFPPLSVKNLLEYTEIF